MNGNRHSSLGIAGLWIAVWAACWAFAGLLYENWFPLALTRVLIFPHWFLMIGAPFAAGGALFGRWGRGLLVGMGIALLLLLAPVFA